MDKKKGNISNDKAQGGVGFELDIKRNKIMLKLIKEKDSVEANCQYYAKKIMPQVRDLWVDKEVIEMMGIKNIHELFEKDFDASKYYKNMSEEEVKDCCLKIAESLLKLADAQIGMFKKLTKHFEEFPNAQKHFNAPALFKKNNEQYVIDFIKLTIDNAVIESEDMEYYQKEVSEIAPSFLLKEFCRYAKRFKDSEEAYCDFLAMGVGTVKLGQITLDVTRTL